MLEYHVEWFNTKARLYRAYNHYRTLRKYIMWIEAEDRKGIHPETDINNLINLLKKGDLNALRREIKAFKEKNLTWRHL